MDVKDILLYSFRKIVAERNIQRNAITVRSQRWASAHRIMFGDDRAARGISLHDQKFVLRRICDEIYNHRRKTLILALRSLHFALALNVTSS